MPAAGVAIPRPAAAWPHARNPTREAVDRAERRGRGMLRERAARRAACVGGSPRAPAGPTGRGEVLRSIDLLHDLRRSTTDLTPAPEKTDSRRAVHALGAAEDLQIGLAERQGKLDALLHRKGLDGLPVPLAKFIGHGSHAGSVDRKPPPFQPVQGVWPVLRFSQLIDNRRKRRPSRTGRQNDRIR